MFEFGCGNIDRYSKAGDGDKRAEADNGQQRRLMEVNKGSEELDRKETGTLETLVIPLPDDRGVTRICARRPEKLGMPLPVEAQRFTTEASISSMFHFEDPKCRISSSTNKALWALCSYIF